MHTLEATRRPPARQSWRGITVRWIATFAGFPAGGFTAMLIVGRVDSVTAALAGGLITGVILGAAQAWGLSRRGPGAIQWVAATAAGLRSAPVPRRSTKPWPPPSGGTAPPAPPHPITEPST